MKLNVTVLDIETLAYPRETLEAMMPEFEAPGNLKDPAKIAAALEAKKQEWIDRAALDATTSTVAVIGMLNCDSFTAYRADKLSERDMLEQAWARIHDDAVVVVGHNLRNFDVPFMVRRSFIAGVKVPFLFHRGRLGERFVDTMELWGAGEWGAKISLDKLARALGVGSKSGKGSDFAAMWADDKDKAIAYCEQDCRLTMACYERMCA